MLEETPLLLILSLTFPFFTFSQNTILHSPSTTMIMLLEDESRPILCVHKSDDGEGDSLSLILHFTSASELVH